MMRPFFLAALTLITFKLQAQKNVFLEQSFWKNNPDVAIIQSEIDKGGNPSESNSMAFDPVVYAINAKVKNESIKFLLTQKGNDINKITHDGRTYLFWAASRGNVELMDYLISKGSKVNIDDSHGMTPIGFAAASGQTDTKVYDLLIKAGANVHQRNQDGASLLLLAIPNDKDLSLTNYFISKGLSLKDVDAAGNTAFNYAAKTGNIELLKTLIQKGVKFNDNAMIMATAGVRGGPGNGIEVYQFLESLKIKPAAVNKNGESVLHSLARRPNQQEVIKYFLSKGIDVNLPDNDGNTAFMNAASANRDTATIALLLPAVKNINQVNKKGVSALAMAVRSNSAEIVQLLLRKGANMNVFDGEGNNIAWYLIQSYNAPGSGGQGGQGVNGQGPGGQGGGPRGDEFSAKMKVLQLAGYDLATPQKDGNTLFHLAAAKNDLSLLQRIQKLNIDVNTKNKEGLTALHKAAMVSKDEGTLKYLLSIGATKDATTEFKETAFDLAKENEYFTKNNVSVDFLK